MADKKITALTELNSTGKVSSTDLLHIIDYSASPVNKKITVSNLLADANTAITSFGAFTHDFGPTNAISGLSVVVPNATPAASAETEVVVNDDGNAFVDFRVQTSLNDKALHIDSSLDSGAGNCNTITINGGAIAGTKKVDFNVNSSTGILVHCDSTDHVVGIGLATPDTDFLLDVAAVGGKSIKTAGSIETTGSITATANGSFTGDLTVTSRLFFNDAIATALNGGADASGQVAIPLTDLVTHLLPADNSHDYYGLANGSAAGQVKVLLNTHATLPIKVTPATTPHVGTTLTLEAGETATLLYTTGGWMMLNYGGGMANS